MQFVVAWFLVPLLVPVGGSHFAEPSPLFPLDSTSLVCTESGHHRCRSTVECGVWCQRSPGCRGIHIQDHNDTELQCSLCVCSPGEAIDLTMTMTNEQLRVETFPVFLPGGCTSHQGPISVSALSLLGACSVLAQPISEPVTYVTSSLIG